MTIKRTNSQKGFSLVELMIYVAGLLVLSAVLSVLTVQFYKIYQEIVAVPRADRTALLVMDRLTKEIRAGDAIDTTESLFNTPSGVLELDVMEEGTSIEKRFYVEDGIIKYSENGGAATNLSPRDLRVTNFNFTLVTTDISQAVRITMEIEYDSRDEVDSKSYTGFAILRESYE